MSAKHKGAVTGDRLVSHRELGDFLRKFGEKAEARMKQLEQHRQYEIDRVRKELAEERAQRRMEVHDAERLHLFTHHRPWWVRLWARLRRRA